MRVVAGAQVELALEVETMFRYLVRLEYGIVGQQY